MDSPTEVLGFVSFNGLNSVQTVFQHLNIEEIKKIQNKVPLNWPDEVSIPIWNVSVKPMEKYLKDNHFLDSENEKEFSIICRSSALHKMFFKPAYKVVEFTIEKTGNTILIEKIMNENDELDAEVAKSEIKYIAKAQLIKMPNGENVQLREADDDVYILTKKRFFYKDGTIVNLFISKEIDAFYEKGTDIVSLIVNLIPQQAIDCREIFPRKFAHPIVVDYFAGGVTHVFSLQKEKHELPEKITVIEDISSIFASAKLEHFKSDLPKFLLNLTKLNFEDGVIVKKGREWEDQTNDKVELFFKHGDSELELSILGSFTAPLEYRRFLNTDFIKMEHFKKGFYKEFMVKPEKILFYGTVVEYAEVLRFMTSDQLAITSRVVGSSV